MIVRWGPPMTVISPRCLPSCAMAQASGISGVVAVTPIMA